MGLIFLLFQDLKFLRLAGFNIKSFATGLISLMSYRLLDSRILS